MAKRQSAKKREDLYRKCCGGNDFPICNLCGLPVTPADAWDESHMPVPKAIGGTQTGIAHRLCNRRHGAKVVTPMVAKGKRVRRRHLGIVGPGMGLKGRPLPASRRTNVKAKVGGGLEARLTLAERLAAAGLIHDRKLARQLNAVRRAMEGR